MVVVRAGFLGFSPKYERVGSRSRAVGNVSRERSKVTVTSVWGREFTSKSVAEQYCRLDCPLDALVIDLKRVRLAQLPDFSLAMCCYLSEIQSKGLLGFRFCQVSKRGRERHGTPLVVQGLTLLPTKGAQG